MIEWLRELLTRRSVVSVGEDRRFQMLEEEPTDRFVLIIALMIVFFAGLISLQIVYLIVMKEWNAAVFNGIMLLIGSIVGAIWGQREAA